MEEAAHSGWRRHLNQPIVFDSRRFDPFHLIQADKPELAKRRRHLAAVSFGLSALSACGIAAVVLALTAENLHAANQQIASRNLHSGLPLLHVAWNWPVVIAFLAGWLIAAGAAVAGVLVALSARREPEPLGGRRWLVGRVGSVAATTTVLLLVIGLGSLALASPTRWFLIVVAAVVIGLSVVTFPARAVLVPAKRSDRRPDHLRLTMAENSTLLAVWLLGSSPWLLPNAAVLNSLQMLVFVTPGHP